MISIIGSGKVGSAVAFLCGSLGLDDVVLVNRNERKAMGEALDISNAIPKSSEISITGTGNYAKIKDSQVVVITASSSVHIQSRSEIMLEQAAMMRKIAKDVANFAPGAKILVVTNPVDAMTYVVQKEGGFPSKNVIGVAASLDSSRFRYILSQEFGTNQSKITNALVMGEHDDSMVTIFSQAKFNGKSVMNLLDEQKKSKITSEVRNYWKYLREYKGYSVFGIAKNTFDIVKCVIKNEALDVPASILLGGEYGLSDVCVGVPLTINKNGVTKIHEINLTENEMDLLQKSANIVKNNTAKALEFLKTSQ
ncbi:MAG: lactate dehydrogenase [Candidatus Nitrosotenuis sp.]